MTLCEQQLILGERVLRQRDQILDLEERLPGALEPRARLGAVVGIAQPTHRSHDRDDDCQWNEVPAPADDANSAGGVGDVKSTAPGEDSNGKSYGDY